MPIPEHSRLINAAAKAALRPLGCAQKGRSRIWLDDRSWWVGIVEFQPSSWARGSYLNVGACWLWYEKDSLSFNAGGRVGSFQEFTSEEQFASIAEELAEQARQEVTAVRDRFPSPSHVQAWLAAKPPASIWDHYHLAVSAGLAGATDQSKRSFEDVLSDPVDWPWATEIKRQSAQLMRCLELGNRFEAKVMAMVNRRRDLLGLPAIPEGAGMGVD
jgi:hypothetical protein